MRCLWLDKNCEPDTYGGLISLWKYKRFKYAPVETLMLSKYLNILIYKAILWYLLWKKEDSCRLSGPEKRCKYLASLLYFVMERNSYTTSLFNEYERQKCPFWQPVFIAGTFAMHFVQPTRVLYYTGLRTFKSIFSNSEFKVSAEFNCLTTQFDCNS